MNEENRNEESTASVPTPPPAYPQQPGAYPQQYQQPGAYPQQGGYPPQGQYPPQYQQPGYPPQQPAWGQQPQGYPPQQGWAQPGAPQTYWGPAGGVVEYGYGSSFLAVIAGIPLLLYGLIVTLGAGAVLFIRSYLDSAITDAVSQGTITLEQGTQIRDGIVVFAVIVLIIGILHVLAAVGIWRHKGWGRALGFLFGILGTLFGLAALAGARSGVSASNSSSSLSGALIILVPYAFVLLAMIISGGHFRRRRVA